jgi:predicted DCC family thiol-disulfide oxidoreductase YuxK
MSVPKIWNHLFLEERPSIGLSFFRIFVALTTGLHVIPAFFAMQDNFAPTALKIHNFNLFDSKFLEAVAQSPEWLVGLFVWLFYIFWFSFLIGLRTQISCIGMTLCCYYFYALNCYHIGTLSWDILLVTLFLMCLTPYPGDYFSLDAIKRRDINAWQRPRPFFIQRLLQIQIALTYFYTAMYKISPQGNWITGNPIYALVNYPHAGVTKDFLFKEWMSVHPQWCYAVGILVLVTEALMPFLLFWPKTRRSAIILGFIFHIILILTLDVPAIFFFLFPAQLLLFIRPQSIVRWIERNRKRQLPLVVLYDGKCGFCATWVERLKIMDLWGRLAFEPVKENLSELKLLDGDITHGGFEAFRRFCLMLPMLYPFLLFVYLPGATWIGNWGYRLVANNRYLLHNNKACADNQCFR